MRKHLLVLIAFWVSLSINAQDWNDNTVWYNGKSVLLEENVDEYLEASAKKSAEEKEYVIVQFETLPDANARKKLKNSGITLYEYMGSKAYLAEISDPQFKKTGIEIRSIMSMDKVSKLSANIQKGDYPKYAMKSNNSIALNLTFFGSACKEQIKQDLESVTACEIRISPFFDRLSCVIPTKNLHLLNNFKWLKVAEPIAPAYEAFDMIGTRQIGVDRINGGIGSHTALTGKGINIGVWDGDVENHYDLAGRVSNHELELHYTEHGTHVTGIMAGQGIIDPLARGVAEDVTMEAWNFNIGNNGLYVAEEMFQSVEDDDIVITQNSYGYAHVGGVYYPYTVAEQELDQVAYAHPELLHIFAAGNSRGTYTYGTTAHSAKNIISVGAIDQFNGMTSFSSWGPVQSGRIAPHVSANGVDAYSCSYYDTYTTMSGTSQATPLVSGVAAQLYELYKSKNDNANPPSSLIKAIICNTAQDLGNEGPDFSYGFGSVNASEAVDVLSKEQYVVDNMESTWGHNKFKIFVPEGMSEIKVMLCWTDPHAPLSNEKALINDLDLWLVNRGEKYRPLVLDGDRPSAAAEPGTDNLNTIEQVVIKAPKAGYYEVWVRGTEVAEGPQEYSIVYQFQEDKIEILSPVGGEVFTPETRNVIYWSAPDSHKEEFVIQLSEDNGASYSTIAKVNADQRMYAWQVEEGLQSGAKIRIISGKYYSESPEKFFIMARPVIDAEDQGQDVTTITWDAVVGANAYNVYQIEGGELTLLEQVTNTEYALNNRNSDKENWYAVSAVNTDMEIESLRSKAMKLTPLKSVEAIPFLEDFDGDKNEYFTLFPSENGQLTINYDPTTQSNYLKFEGIETDAIYTSKEAVEALWVYNDEFISKAKMKPFTSEGVASLILSFDLRQCYAMSENANVFRVLVNGEPISDVTGTKNFLAETWNSDQLSKRYFDLSAYIGTEIEIEFWAMCQYPSGYVPGASHGDVVHIDNIKISEKPDNDFAVVDYTFPERSKLRLSNETVGIKVINLSSSAISNFTVDYTLYKNEKPQPKVSKLIEGSLESMQMFEYSFPELADLSDEDSLFNVEVGVSHPDDQDDSNNKKTSPEIYNYGDILPMSSNGYTATETVEESGLVFTDGGTRVFNYPDATTSIYTFYPADLSKKVKISFSEFNLEEDYDYLYLFAGKEVAGTPIAVLNGTLNNLDQTEFISTSIDGTLTVLFYSDDYVNESGWVANLSITDNPTQFDIGVMAITNPVSAENLSSKEQVQVQVGNFGTLDVHSYTVAYSVNGGDLIEKTINNTLRAGSYSFISFSQYEDFTEFGTEYNIKAYATLTNDEIHYNDTATVSFKSDYESAFGFGDLYIENVSLEQINQGSGDNMYQDFSSLIAEMTYGESYELIVTKNQELGSGKYWIDWNYDGLFDDSETYEFDKSEGRSLKATITPPNSTLPGKKRLRIRVVTFGDIEATGGQITGEVEDYSIKVTGEQPAKDAAVKAIDLNEIVAAGNRTVKVIVVNGSQTDETLTVSLQIGTEYNSSLTTDLIPSGSEQIIEFNDVNLTVGEFEVVASVELSGDEIENNNSLSQTVNVQQITTVYAYSILGVGPISAGSIKFNLENVENLYQVEARNSFYTYCGTIDENNWYVSSSGGALSTIDFESGEISTIGASGVSTRDMAFDPSSDVIYGRAYESTEVLSIDPATGEATVVGNISNINISTFACDITGKLYGLDNTGMLYSVDKTTWVATEIGSTGVYTGSSPHPALFFDNNTGNLYMTGRNNTMTSDDYEIRRVNTSTGRSYLVGINNNFAYSLGYSIPYSETAAKGLAEVLDFSIDGNPFDATIDAENNQIRLHVTQSDDLSNLTVKFALSPGATATLGGSSLLSGGTADVNTNNNLVVTSMDGSNSKTWTIVVEEPINDEALLISYNLIPANGNKVVGNIDGFSVSADIEPSVMFKSLVAEFEVSTRAKVYVNNIEIESGATPLNYSNEFVLKIVAEDNINENYYLVNVSRSINNEAELTALVTKVENNAELTEDLTGIFKTDSVKVADVPVGVTELIPNFTASAGSVVTVEDAIQVSGLDSHDFTEAVSYDVTSEDGSTTNTYVVTISNLVGVYKINSSEFNVYPNPTKERIFLSTPETGIVKMYNIHGALVLTEDLQDTHSVINLNNYNPGIYILKFDGDTQKHVSRIVIK